MKAQHPTPRLVPGRLCPGRCSGQHHQHSQTVCYQVMSYGMVLCASDDAHGSVEPVNVPDGVPLGERIQFEGYTGMPKLWTMCTGTGTANSDPHCAHWSRHGVK